MVAHAYIQLPILLPQKKISSVRYGEAMFQIWCEDRSISDLTILSTDAGRTDGCLRNFIFCPMHMHCIILHCIGQTKIRYCANKKRWIFETPCIIDCLLYIGDVDRYPDVIRSVLQRHILMPGLGRERWIIHTTTRRTAIIQFITTTSTVNISQGRTAGPPYTSSTSKWVQWCLHVKLKPATKLRNLHLSCMQLPKSTKN